jgi:predicted PurR-regulated permease PerM
VRGTIDGLVLVGLGEGAVMAVAYVLLGVPHPILLGIATAIAAMIPFGAAVMFEIAAFALLTQDSVTGAILINVIGFAVVGIADHFVRPVLIGGATRLPFLWVLLGILGGVETLGLLGLFVGPATMAVLVMLWREFVERKAIPPVEVA